MSEYTKVIWKQTFSAWIFEIHHGGYDVVHI